MSVDEQQNEYDDKTNDVSNSFIRLQVIPITREDQTQSGNVGNIY